MEDDKNFITIPDNVTVNIDIFAIILGVDSSLLNFRMGNGYRVQEIDLNDCLFKNQIVMENGNVNSKYLSSQTTSINSHLENKKFICLSKHDSLISPSPLQNSVNYIGDRLLFRDEADRYKEEQFIYLNDLFSKLMLYKEGDIGLYEIFFRFTSNFLVFNENYESTISISDANTICCNKFILDSNDIETVDIFLRDHDAAIGLLNIPIDNFIYSYKLLYDAKAFELLVTTLEILFLYKNQTRKKKMLAKRLAVFLGSDPLLIFNIYNEIIGYYEYRSESVHEGEDMNITNQRLLGLREYVRLALKKYFSIIENELITDRNTSFEIVRNRLLSSLDLDVDLKIRNGVLPSI